MPDENYKDKISVLNKTIEKTAKNVEANGWNIYTNNKLKCKQSRIKTIKRLTRAIKKKLWTY